MSTTANNTPFGKYMAFCHTERPNNTDFKLLEQQLEREESWYKSALEEAYALKGIMSTKKRQIALKTLDEAHNAFQDEARAIVKEFERRYLELDMEWKKLEPRYIMKVEVSEQEKTQNAAEFKRFCRSFAKTYGEWFWKIRLRNDPIDDMNFGSNSIADLQESKCENWYPWMEEWRAIPYGARLMMLYQDLGWLDLTLRILIERGIYKNRPSTEVYKILGIEK